MFSLFAAIDSLQTRKAQGNKILLENFSLIKQPKKSKMSKRFKAMESSKLNQNFLSQIFKLLPLKFQLTSNYLDSRYSFSIARINTATKISPWGVWKKNVTPILTRDGSIIIFSILFQLI